MAAKPLTGEAIALTEKKMDMALDDIIKMSKNATNKGNKQRRVLNKNLKLSGAKMNALKVRRYMDSRSAVRQGALAKRRSNFQGNHFPLTTEVAQKAAVAPIRGRAFKSNRAAKTNKPRIGAHPDQRAGSGGFTSKHENQKQQGNGAAAKQRTQSQTLDSLFANMKEQRSMVFSSQQKSSNTRGNGGGRRPMVPWARGRFGN